MRLLAAAVACLVWTTPAGVSATENAIEEQGAGEPLSEAYERGDEEKAPRVASVALLALPVPALLEKMNSLQRQFFQAVLPESWAIPRYDMAVDGELPKVRKWIQEATDALAAPSVSATFTRIQGHLSGEALDEDFQEALKELPPTPPFLMELLRVSPLAQKTSAASTEEEALLPLPTVDVTRVEALAKTFSPQKLEWPVEKEGVSLFLPVIAPLQRTAEQLEAQLKRLLQDRSADLEELLLPLTGPTGDLLFAKLKAVFKGVSLPEAVSVVPIALIENLQAGSLDAPAASCPARMASENRAREEGAAISSFVVLQASDLSSLWSAVKLPILNKELLLLGRDAPALWGPSMGLASLPRVSLALEGVPLHTAEQQKRPSLAALLQRASATVKSQVYRGSLSKVEESASGEELSDLSFLNFSLPVIGEDTQGLLLRKARRALRLMREFEELWFCLCGFQLAAVARTLAPLIFSTKGDVPGEDCSSAEKGVSCELSWGSPSDAATASESALKPALVKAPFSLSQEGILRLFAKVEALAAALASAVADLQSRIDDVLQSQLSVSAAVPAEVLSEAVSAARRGVGAATAVAASLRRQLSLAKIRLQDALGASQLLRLPSIDKKAAASEGDSQSLNEAPKAPLQEQEKEEEGLLAKRRRRLAPADQERLTAFSSRSASVPDVARLLTPGDSSLLDLTSLKALADAVAALPGKDFLSAAGVRLPPASAAAQRVAEGASLRELFSLHLLPPQVLEAPLAPLASNGEQAVAALASGPLGGALNLGQTLALSEALEKVFALPLAELPSLQSLALDPQALAAAVTAGADRAAKLSDAFFKTAQLDPSSKSPEGLVPSLWQVPRLVPATAAGGDGSLLTSLSVFY